MSDRRPGRVRCETMPTLWSGRLSGVRRGCICTAPSAARGNARLCCGSCGSSSPVVAKDVCCGGDVREARGGQVRADHKLVLEGCNATTLGQYCQWRTHMVLHTHGWQSSTATSTVCACNLNLWLEWRDAWLCLPRPSSLCQCL